MWPKLHARKRLRLTAQVRILYVQASYLSNHSFYSVHAAWKDCRDEYLLKKLREKGHTLMRTPLIFICST